MGDLAGNHSVTTNTTEHDKQRCENSTLIMCKFLRDRLTNDDGLFIVHRPPFRKVANINAVRVLEML